MKSILSLRRALPPVFKQFVAVIKYALFGLIALGLITSLPSGLRADPLDNWHVRNPTVPLGNYQTVAFANGTFVTYNVAGSIITSTDGTNWRANLVGWGNPSCLNIANGRFYLGFGYGNMLSSSDGVNWTVINWPANNTITDVTFGNGLYIASTFLDFASKNLTTSASPITGPWTTRSDNLAYNAESVAFGNGVFVVAGDSGTIASSANGISWTIRSSGTSSNLRRVRYGNGTFIAVGDSGTVLTSSNGVTWSNRVSGTAQSLSGVGFANGLWIAVGSAGTILSSTDGIDWSGQPSGTTSDLNGIAFGNSSFVVAGNNTSILTSPDGTNWTSLRALTSQNLASVSYGSSNFVAVGFAGTVLGSTDGTSWVQRNSGTALDLYSITWGKNIFVAAGQTIISSPDCINWTTRDSESGLSIEAVAFLNGSFMAVGDNGIMRVSTDGLAWTSRSSGTSTTLYSLTYGNGLYVVVGSGGTLRTSPNGTTWTARTSGTTQDLNGVTFAKGRFVAQGNGGVILTSSNGTAWTPQNSGTAQGLATCAFGSDSYVIVGFNGTILTSTNAVAWTIRPSPSYALLVGVTFGAGSTNGSFEIVGYGGTIIQSDGLPVGPSITLQPVSQSTTCHNNAIFTVDAAGTPPLGYQWQRNGVPLLGATNTAYGVTPLTCQSPDNYSVVVTNSGGSITSAVATLTVVDTTPPAIICPTNLLVNTDPGQCSAVVNYSVTATDDCAVVSLTFNLPPGSAFPKGTNVVLCTATDCAGNTNNCSFTVTVLDGEAPVVICPADQVVPCTSTNGAQVFFTTIANDNCDASLTVTSTPASGSYFTLGTNIVTCVSTDASGNSNSGTFTITVVESAPVLNVALNGTNIVLSWPQSCALYLVEQRTELDAGPDWSPVNIPPVPVADRFVIAVPLNGESQFFRLKRI
jgi:hypothetical protein